MPPARSSASSFFPREASSPICVTCMNSFERVCRCAVVCCRLFGARSSTGCAAARAAHPSAAPRHHDRDGNAAGRLSFPPWAPPRILLVPRLRIGVTGRRGGALASAVAPARADASSLRLHGQRDGDAAGGALASCRGPHPRARLVLSSLFSRLRHVYEQFQTGWADVPWGVVGCSA
eukprot:CAMPEP_0119470354 /NCGR_PEP_ID=MMETSP1344-20130328/3288_1 /TAXON_ID=236787 /ORGANISM="Florenciella parvula, Strain CCMP2471" /LENGTH=176 /DNA_ID=CAMNT_0007503013 /DNA_START=1011 /DNA_END=1542 /DNA_ORIENTATION=+